MILCCYFQNNNFIFHKTFQKVQSYYFVELILNDLCSFYCQSVKMMFKWLTLNFILYDKDADNRLTIKYMHFYCQP